MTRDEALKATDRIEVRDLWHLDADDIAALRTYILNSIPTPKVEVVEVPPRTVNSPYMGLLVNGKTIAQEGENATIGSISTNLISALQGSGE